MITFVLAFAFAGGVFSATYYLGDWGLGWSITTGVLGFVAFQGTVSVLIQKRVKREMESVQKILANGQNQLQQKMQRWRLRPPGSIQVMQREVLEDTKVFVKDALAQTENLRKYRLWVPMMERQIATAKFQLCWLVKDFKTIDQLMAKAFFVDPTMTAMKLARLYMLDKPLNDMLKVYAKGVARTRYNGNVLLAATMSWIQVRRNDPDGAFKTLTEALKKSDNETLKQNHEHLMNNRPAHFSNSGLGDQWYSLLLEEPRMRTPRQHNIYR